MSGATTSVQPDEQSRRTMMLNVERTWLAWWRTGLVSAAAAVALGRVAPEVLDGHDWPYVVIGTGYAALAVALLILGGIRQRSLKRELQEGRFPDLSGMWVAAITVAGAGLAVITMLLVLIEAQQPAKPAPRSTRRALFAFLGELSSSASSPPAHPLRRFQSVSSAAVNPMVEPFVA